MDITSTPDLGAYSGLPDLTLIAGGTMNVDAMVGYSSGYTVNNLVVGASALNVGTYSYGRLSALNSVTIGTTGDIALNNGAWITTDPSGGLVTIVSGGALSLDHSSGIGGGAGVVIGATNIRLDHDSWIETGDGVPAPDIKVTISGGDLVLNNGSEIIAGNDVILTLTGPDARVVLNEDAGLPPSRIWSDAGTGTPGTTVINFLGRSSDGVVIDGTATTTTAVNGSGFFTVDLDTPAILDGSLVINYSSGSASNDAKKVIDQFFHDLTDNNPPAADEGEKKKKGNGADTEGNNQGEHHDNHTGQCT